jgi:hypothetical protein
MGPFHLLRLRAAALALRELAQTGAKREPDRAKQ